MIVTIVILSALVIALGWYSFYATRKLLSNSDKFDDIEVQLAESLDILDDVYKNITTKSRMEVFSDEPVIRDLLRDIKRARTAVLLVANKVVSSTETGENDGV